MKTSSRKVRRAAAAALPLAATLALLAGDPAAARPRHRHAEPTPAAPAEAGSLATGTIAVSSDSSGYAGQLTLSAGGSRVLKFARPYGRVMVGDPKIADVVPLGDRTLYVFGKAPGASSLTVMSAEGGTRALATLDLRVGFDGEALQRSLKATMPDEPITVTPSGDGLVLDGTVSSSLVAARAVALADHFAPGKVINLMAVRGPEQVMLKVEVAEVQRSVLRQLGVSDFAAIWTDVSHGLIPPTPPAVTINPSSFANILGLAGIGKNASAQAFLQALESKGYASILAQPTLVAISGQPATFFAGGEFPVPIPQIQSGNTILTIQFKPYGVSVGFTPTVYGDTISLLVAPEVSALDPQNAVNLQGYKIPGITTRRAKTTIELRDGQSFAIAGLIRKDFTDNLRGLPGAASLPVFGALFRSTSYQKNETEIVMIVTVHLAQPTDRKNLLLPQDTREAPTGAELILSNTVDKPTTPSAAAGSAMEAHP